MLGKEPKSVRKKDVPESRQFPNITKRLRIAHKSPGGEQGIDLTALVTPTEWSANGFANPSSTEIAAANLYMNKNAVRIESSVRGPLKLHDPNGVSIANSTFIAFNFGTSYLNEIFEILIDPTPAYSPVVADARSFDTGWFEQPVGQTTVNVGYQFSMTDTIVVMRNNQEIIEGTDFVRVDNGTGYGTSLTLTNAPLVVVDNMRVRGGLLIGRSDLETFGSIERLAGAVLKLSQDAASGFYGDSDYTRYLNASPTEISRRAFGDSVLSLLSRATALESLFTAGTFTPGISFSGGTGSATISGTMNYFKIGRLVCIFGTPLLTKGTGSGTVSITGLPYAIAAGAGDGFGQPLMINNGNNLTLSSELVNASVTGTTMNWIRVSITSGGINPLTAAEMPVAASGFRINFSYITN